MAVNGLYIVQGELNCVVALLRKAHRNFGPAHVQMHHQPLLDEDEPLLRNFTDLREVLNNVSDLADMSPSAFLGPFLDVIKSEVTNGPTTGQALASVGKFLSYGLVDPASITAASAVENIADAVTHARFVGGADAAGDEVVLLKILQVLRTLMLTPVGRLLSNESVCEIMQSGFRICFETRLSELLRKAAESTLADMVQLLFTRLPTFKEDTRHPYIRKLKMRATMGTETLRRHKYGKKKQKGNAASGTTRKSSLKKTDSRDVDGAVKDDNTSEPIDSSNVEAALDQAASEQPELSGDNDDAPEQSMNEVNAELATDNAPTTDAVDAAPPTPHVVDVHENLGFQSDDEGATMQRDTSSAVLETVSSSADFSATHQAEQQTSTDGASQQFEQSAKNEPSDSAQPTDDTNEPATNDDDQQPKQRRTSVRFTVDDETLEKPTAPDSKNNKSSNDSESTGTHMPYGLPCVREVLRFLVSLTSPLDRQNTEGMISLGLNLSTIALEAGADHLGSYSLLMPLVKNELCRSLIALLQTDKLQLFASALRVGFLLMESLRTHLKLQLEAYLKRLMDLVVADHHHTSFEKKELALEALDQLWRIPGLVTELYLNYDCDVYCSNLFEDIVKLLGKNSFPVSLLSSTHILSMDALLTVVDTIDTNCHYRANGLTYDQTDNEQPSSPSAVRSPQFQLPAVSGFDIGKQMLDADTQRQQESEEKKTEQKEQQGTEKDANVPTLLTQFRPNRMPLSKTIPSREQLIDQKKRKRLLTAGTELFNQSPSKGIALLHEHGLLLSHVPEEVVKWLKENPGLDKKKIADYIVSRKNAIILETFVKSFPFENVRIDDALRVFLETFRLPGEAAEISMVMTHFAEHWFKSNDDPFVNTDAAFTLSYAIIMLNTDQHNPQVQKNQQPMTLACFKKNLRGCNGGGDFDAELLEDIYDAIKNDEIVMPAEQTGVIRENYLWKVLLRRGITHEGEFSHVPSGYNDHDLFLILWGPTIAALSFVFDKSDQEPILQKALTGFRKCARIAAHYGMSDVFDNLVISLCKFSQLMGGSSAGDIGGQGAASMAQQQQNSQNDSTRLESGQAVAVRFGENHKAQMAARAMFSLVHDHGDILREGWKNLLDCLLTLYMADLLPTSLTEVEDFVDTKGWVSIIRKPVAKSPAHRSDSGLLSSFVYFLGGSSSETREPRQPTAEEQDFIKIAHSVINECHPEQLVTDSKYLTRSALEELIQSIVLSSATLTETVVPPATLSVSIENAMVFYLELLVSTALDNKDRLPFFWANVRRHLQSLLSNYPKNKLLIERTVVGLLRLTNRNLFRLKEDISDEVLQSLTMLQSLSPFSTLALSQQMAFGLHDLLRSNAANVHRSQHWSILFALLEQCGAGALCMIGEENMGALGQRETQSDGDEGRPSSAAGHYSGGSQQQSGTLHRGYTSDTDLSQGYHTGSGPGGSHSGSLAGSEEWIKLDKPNEQKDANMPLSQHRRFTFDRTQIVLRAGLQKHDPRAYLKCAETLAFLVRDAAHITPDNFESAVRCLRAFVEASLDGGRYVPPSDENPDDAGNNGKNSGKNGKGKSRAMKKAMHLQRADKRKKDKHTKQDEEAEEGATVEQRAFLIQDLHLLGPTEWEDCFAQVLFPLLSKLAENISPMDPLGMEETRYRAVALLSKVLLNHLSPLSSLKSFRSLWLTILDFMDRYLHTDRSDLLSEAIPESLKNMVLILDNTGMFLTIPGLYDITKERLATFLPDLMDKVLPNPPAPPTQQHQPPHQPPPQQPPSQQQPATQSSSSSATTTTTHDHSTTTPATEQSGSGSNVCQQGEEDMSHLESIVISQPIEMQPSPHPAEPNPTMTITNQHTAPPTNQHAATTPAQGGLLHGIPNRMPAHASPQHIILHPPAPMPQPPGQSVQQQQQQP